MNETDDSVLFAEEELFRELEIYNIKFSRNKFHYYRK